jgi:TPR repeat protein
MYEFGEGLTKDLRKAEECYRKSRSFHDRVPLLRVMAAQGKIGEADFWKHWIFAYKPKNRCRTFTPLR